MGSPAGAPIPVIYNGAQVGYKKDQSGNTVITKLDESMLQELASAGKGKYIRANAADDGFSAITAEIERMDKKELGSKMFTDYEDRFYYFFAAALILLVGELFITERKSKWLLRLNLFGEGGK
jgi:Ca-activated chloride channel family protein